MADVICAVVDGSIVITETSTRPVTQVKCYGCGQVYAVVDGMVHMGCAGCSNCNDWLGKEVVIEICRDCGCKDIAACKGCSIWAAREHHKIMRISHESSLRELLESGQTASV